MPDTGPPSGRAPSQASRVASNAASRVASPARSAAGPGQPGWTQGPGFDPARMGTAKKGNTRMELPPDAYVLDSKKSMFTLRGNKLNTEGSPAVVEVNQYRMTKFDFTKKIYQYDVSNVGTYRFVASSNHFPRWPYPPTRIRRPLSSRRSGSTPHSRRLCKSTTTTCGFAMETSLPGPHRWLIVARFA